MDDIYIIEDFHGMNITGILSDYESIIWNVQFYGLDEFQIIISATEENLSRFKIGTLLCRSGDVSSNRFSNVMVVENLQMNFEIESGWKLTISGRGIKSILSRRVIWNQISVENTKVIDLISRVISENVSVSGNRKLLDVSISYVSADFTERTDSQLFGENVADWMQSVCQQYSYGWKIDIGINTSTYYLTIYKGEDRTSSGGLNSTVIFSPEFDNLLSVEYEYKNSNFANAAIIGGEGEGSSQITDSIGTSSGLNRYEVYIDGSGVSSNGEIITLETYKKMLQEYGKLQLSDKKFAESLSGEIDSNGVYKINNDFYLGDKVEINTNRGISGTARIIEIIYSSDESGSAVIPTFSEMEVN